MMSISVSKVVVIYVADACRSSSNTVLHIYHSHLCPASTLCDYDHIHVQLSKLNGWSMFIIN